MEGKIVYPNGKPSRNIFLGIIKAVFVFIAHFVDYRCIHNSDSDWRNLFLHVDRNQHIDNLVFVIGHHDWTKEQPRNDFNRRVWITLQRDEYGRSIVHVVAPIDYFLGIESRRYPYPSPDRMFSTDLLVDHLHWIGNLHWDQRVFHRVAVSIPEVDLHHVESSRRVREQLELSDSSMFRLILKLETTSDYFDGIERKDIYRLLPRMIRAI